MNRIAPLAALALSLAAPRLASAEPTPPVDRFGDRPHAVSVVLGAAAPTGMLGVQYEHALAAWLTVSGGAGAGLASPQAATMVRLRTAGWRTAAGAGFGASYGGARIPRDDPFGPDGHDELRGAVWLNAAVYLERRTANGVVLRFEAGAGRSVRTASCQHVEEAGSTYAEDQVRSCYEDEAHLTLPFAALMVGKAF